MTKNIYYPMLIKINKKYCEIYKENALMRLLETKKVHSKKTRGALLDCIQTMSDYFQKVVLLRNALCDDKNYIPITLDHLREEFLHNASLMKDRKNRPAKWDPILEATSSWFSWKMLTLDNQEKTILVHFVLENSGNIFFRKAYKILGKYGETNYFKIHSEADEKHTKMGASLLKNVSQENVERLFEVLNQGWEVLNAACNRMAELTNLT